MEASESSKVEGAQLEAASLLFLEGVQLEVV